MYERDLQYIRVLLIEDDEDDCILLDRLLAEVSSAQYEVTWIQTYEDGLKELERGIYDVCLLDYHLGSRSGLEILSMVEESPETPPIIVLTGQGDYLVDLKAMKYGAADFLVKDQMSGPLLERAIRYSMDRKKSKDALLESETQLKHLSSALLKVQENERRMVAAELHDDLGQLLTAIKFNIESVLVRMDPGESCTADLEGHYTEDSGRRRASPQHVHGTDAHSSGRPRYSGDAELVLQRISKRPPRYRGGIGIQGQRARDI